MNLRTGIFWCFASATLCCNAPPSASAAETGQIVFTEGAGATRAEAAADGLRHALRQSLAHLAESAQLAALNDVLEEKVLATPDKFAKDHILLSAKESHGLHRVRLKVTVDFAGLADAMKALEKPAASTEPGADRPPVGAGATADAGKGLFADAIERAEAGKNNVSEIKKAIRNTAGLLVAEVAGKPTFDPITSQVSYALEFSISPEAYGKYSQGVEDVLKKIAKRRETIVLKGMLADEKWAIAPLAGATPWGPSVADVGENAWSVWVCSPPTEDSSLRWNAYVIDPPFNEVLRNLDHLDPHLNAVPTTLPTSFPSPKVVVEFSNGDGRSVVTDKFQLFRKKDVYWSGRFEKENPVHLDFSGIVRTYQVRSLSGEAEGEDSYVSPVDELWERKARGDKGWTMNLYVAPLAFGFEDGSLKYRSRFTCGRAFKASADDLKSVKSVKCTVEWSPATK